jgi:hypothetical protein
VVADAVLVEPVSASKFPANREKYREFASKRDNPRTFRGRDACRFMDLGLQFPKHRNREISEMNRERTNPIRETFMPVEIKRKAVS